MAVADHRRRYRLPRDGPDVSWDIPESAETTGPSWTEPHSTAASEPAEPVNSRGGGSRDGRRRLDDGVDEPRTVRRCQALGPYQHNWHALFPLLSLGQISALAIEFGFAVDLKAKVRLLGQEGVYLRMVRDILSKLDCEF